MSRIIKINPSTIRPSQDFLKKDTLAFIKENFDKGAFDKMPPIPIVRKAPDESYIAIDGHNLLAFYTMHKMECEVFVAEHADDGIPGNFEMIKKRNADLKEKYDSALEQSEKLADKGIHTIEDLLTHLI